MIPWLLGLALFAPLTGCKQAAGPAGPADSTAPLKITCTIGMIGDVAQEIGGEQVVVTSLMGSGVDPHLYKASQGDLARLNEADVILYNGLHLEGRMADVLVGMASRVKTYQVTDQIDPTLLREPPEFQGNYDPHVWFDVSLWQKVAERIHAILVESRPEQKGYFDERAAAYQAKLAELHEYARTRIATIPEDHRVLVTAHDAFGYFGRAYGLEVMGIQGISTSSEYGLQDLNKLVELLVSRKIQAVFVETSISHASIEALIAGAASKGHTVRLGGTLYSDAMGETGTPEGTYLGMVRHNVDTIVEALKSDASPG
ncbi:MAG: zinc ABC transporter substrate-binding protein [Candidatus Hydrogenedentes bacterium]|nr:zinc ABC transporter substrate-binding protein [Candidatus Hydrogenedentota bacterium]